MVQNVNSIEDPWSIATVPINLQKLIDTFIHFPQTHSAHLDVVKCSVWISRLFFPSFACSLSHCLLPTYRNQALWSTWARHLFLDDLPRAWTWCLWSDRAPAFRKSGACARVCTWDWRAMRSNAIPEMTAESLCNSATQLLSQPVMLQTPILLSIMLNSYRAILEIHGNSTLQNDPKCMIMYLCRTILVDSELLS